MTPEQQKAIALSRARRRRAESEGAGKQTWGEWAYGNIVGNPDDDVTNFGESLGTWLNRAGESATLGVVGDEASAAVTGMLPGRSYDAELARYRDNEDAMSGVGQFTADVAGGLVPAMTGVGAMASAPTLGMAALRGAGLGVGAGAVQGFMEGEDGLADRLGGAAVGGTIGGVIGGAVPVLGDMARRGVRGISDWRRGSAIGNSVGEALDINPQSARVLTDVMQGQDSQSVAAALARGGDQAMLADVPAMTGVLDATMRSPTQGAALAGQRIGDRASVAGDEIVDALRGNRPGPYQGAVSTERAVTSANRQVVNPLYERAYNTPINYAAPEGQAIEELVTRVPPKQLRRAIEKATDEMVYDGLPNLQIIASIADDGTVSFAQKPNVMQLDYIKRAFDEIADDGKDPLTGAMTSEGRFASRVARDIRDATKAAVPEYGEALSQAATGIRQRGAVRDGAKLLDPSMTVETASEVISGATEAEKRLMREGLVAQIEHKLGNIRAVASDQNVDAREAAKAWADLSSENTQRKMSQLFGDEWSGIKDTLDRAGAAVGLRANTAANSATAQRQFTNEMIDDITQPGALASGQPIQAARNLVGGMFGTSPDAVSSMRGDIRSDIADVLTRQGGTAQTAQRAIAEALMRNPQNPIAGRSTEQVIRALGLLAIPQATGSANEVLLDPINLEAR